MLKSITPLFYLIVVLFVILTACNSSEDNQLNTSLNNDETELLSQALKEAKENKDYRLYSFAGRRLIIPGFENRQPDIVKSRCGTKILKGTSDVLKTSEDRIKRKAQYQFASNYNLEVYSLCIESPKEI